MTSTRSRGRTGPAPWSHPALRWAQHIDPAHVAAAPSTPDHLRNVKTLDNSATAVGTERLRRTRDMNTMRRRRDAARRNADGSAALARSHQRRGSTAQAEQWSAEADRLTAAADALTVWILWLGRAATIGPDPRSFAMWLHLVLTTDDLADVPEQPPEGRHPVACRAPRREPRSPRAPTLSRAHVTV